MSSENGFSSKAFPSILAFLIAVGGVGIGLAWKTEYLDRWLPDAVKEFFGKTVVSEEETPPVEEEEGEEESETGELETEVEEDPTANWELYINTKYGYGIKYPSDWTYREYTAETGAGFRPLSKPDSSQYEFITIDLCTDAPQYLMDMSFEEYAKVAATEEIQGYASLASIETVTAGGLVGYKTTWNVIPMSGLGGTQVSEPITYFDASLIGGRSIQIGLGYLEELNAAEQSSILDIYDKMITAFELD